MPRTVAILEPNPAWREALASFVGGLGYEVQAASCERDLRPSDVLIGPEAAIDALASEPAARTVVALPWRCSPRSIREALAQVADG